MKRKRLSVKSPNLKVIVIAHNKAKRKTQSNLMSSTGSNVCVRLNLVFGAIFESVSDDKYFLAVIFKKDHHPFYRVMVLFCLVHLISS